MLSILFRDTSRCLRAASILKSNLPVFSAGVNYSNFTVNDILYDNSDETGTLLTRFVKYLAIENSKFDPLVPSTIKYADFFPISEVHSFKSELRKINVTQIPHLIVFAFTYKSNGDPQKFVKILNEVDRFCEVNLKQMDYDTILRTLYAFMFLLPSKITKTSFYKNAMDRLVNNFGEDFPKEKFVKACFYLGLGKKNPFTGKLLAQLLETHLIKYMPELSQMDISIIGNAAYKSSVAINNEQFVNKAVSEVLRMDSVADDAILVNLVKVLRHNEVKSEEVCRKLDGLCGEKALSAFQMTGVTHLFAYFAEFSWNNEATCTKFINEGIYRLRESAEYIRGKDLSTFLWCCAHLQLSKLLQLEDLKDIERSILSKVERDEFRYFPDQLIDSALSLWMLGYHSRGLISEIIGLKTNQNAKKTGRDKLDTRYNVLLSCVAIEKPDWLVGVSHQAFDEDLTAPNYLIKNRLGLRNAMEKLKEDGIGAKIVTPIKGINFAGILIELSKEQKVYLEVLEDEHILRFDKTPNAIVQLKIRLLKHLGYNVVTTRANELDTKSIKNTLLALEESTTQVESKAAI